MKNLYIAVLAIIAIMQSGYATERRSSLGQGRGELEGTWELTSYKYRDEKNFSDAPKNQRHIKLMTQTHFIWVTYDVDQKKPLSTAGGTYSLQGDTYKEQIQFAGEGGEELAGKEQSFKVKIENDRLSLSGVLTSGLKLEEVWKRLK